MVSHADHPCLRVFIDMNNVICLLVVNEFIVGVFFKKSFFLGSIHVPFLETLILHYTAVVLGMAYKLSVFPILAPQMKETLAPETVKV